ANRAPIKKSLRIAFSLTDLGIIHYNTTPLTASGYRETALVEEQDPLQSKFIGAPGQFLSYFEEAEALSNPLSDPDELSEDSFSGLLPTSFNVGALLDLYRLKLMGDFTLALNKTAFSGTELMAHLGVETRLLPFIPIRLGTRIAAGAPVAVGL